MGSFLPDRLFMRRRDGAADPPVEGGIEHPDPATEEYLYRLCEDCRQVLSPKPAATRVQMSPGALAACVGHAWAFPENEVGLLALGRIEGNSVVVTRAVPAENIGTATDIEFTPQDFGRVREHAREGEITVGWVHSHPGHTVFFSDTDVKFQRQAQQLNPEWIGIVIDPFQEGRIEMKCYRVRDGMPIEIPVGPGRGEHGEKADVH